MGVTVWLLSKLVILSLIFQFIWWIRLELVVWMRLELLEILVWLDRWLSLLERILVWVKVVVSSKFILIQWLSIITVLVGLILSELRLWSRFETLLMSIKLQLFIQPLIVVAWLGITSRRHWFQRWFECWAIGVHHVCLWYMTLDYWWGLRFTFLNLLLLFLFLILSSTLSCHWRLTVWFSILFLWSHFILFLFRLGLFLWRNLLWYLLLRWFFFISLFRIFWIFLLASEFVRNIECINNFLPLNLIR